MSELNLDELLARTGRRNFRCGRMTVRTLLDKIGELEAQIERVRDRHSPLKIYGECEHDKPEDHNGDLIEVAEIGMVCQDGYLYSICRECCTEGGEQTEVCATYHTHSDVSGVWLCPTRKDIDGEEVNSDA